MKTYISFRGASVEIYENGRRTGYLNIIEYTEENVENKTEKPSSKPAKQTRGDMSTSDLGGAALQPDQGQYRPAAKPKKRPRK